MAGVGFALRRLARQDTLTSGLRAYAHAAAVSSGPWLFTILSLGGVEMFAPRRAGGGGGAALFGAL